jgi:hypothetical protein
MIDFSSRAPARQPFGSRFEPALSHGRFLGPRKGRHPMVKWMAAISAKNKRVNETSETFLSVVICNFCGFRRMGCALVSTVIAVEKLPWQIRDMERRSPD